MAFSIFWISNSCIYIAVWSFFNDNCYCCPYWIRIDGIWKVFVLAIDDIEDSMNVARHIRLNYQNLKLLVRARDRHHVHLLRDLGVEQIWRETYLSSLGMAYRALRELDISEEDAYKSIELFRDYDEKLLIQQQRIYTDEQKIYETHRNALAELEHLFESDAQIRQEPTGVNLQRGLAHPRIDVTRDDSN